MLCNHNVATVARRDSIEAAAMKMRDSHVGDLIVTEMRDGRVVPVGIVTDRDLVVEVLAESVAVDAVTVEDIMTTDLLSVNEDNGLEFTVRKMCDKGVRRVPVVDDEGTLIGVLSLDDVIEHVATLTSCIAKGVQLELRTEAEKRP